MEFKSFLPQVNNALEDLERIRINRIKLDMLEYKLIRDLRMYQTPWKYIADAMKMSGDMAAKQKFQRFDKLWAGLEWREGMFQATGQYDPARDREAEVL